MGQHLQDLEERNAVLEKDVEKFRERERQLDNVKPKFKSLIYFFFLQKYRLKKWNKNVPG